MNAPFATRPVEESHVSSADGLRLATYFLQAEPEIARVVLTHGMGEHAGRYPHVMAHLAASGISCATYDLRGHGRSGGFRGRLSHYRDFLEDLDAILRHFRSPNSPNFLYGHSLGGQITINYIVTFAPPIEGVVLASPWLKLAFRPPLWRLALAAATSRILPGFTQNAPTLEEKLSRDLEWLASLRNSTLAHRRMSAGMFSALQSGARLARTSADRFRIPFLLMHGSADNVTSQAASEIFFRAAPSADKEMKPWPEMRHETHNEIGRESVLAYATDWVLSRATPSRG